jgi:hypothetical protein
VFLQLARELESQGVKRAVAADMFGMALRTYQKKIARVAESASVQGKTLWEAVYELIKHESPTRRRVLERFRNDGEREVSSVLRDLVSNGMVFVTGDGLNVAYGVTSERMQSQVVEARDFEAVAHVIWLKVFQGVADRASLSASLGIDEWQVQRALEELEGAGRVQQRDGLWVTRNVHIPMGSTSGAEAAMLDHFRAVCNVLTSRSRAFFVPTVNEAGADDAHRASADGGSTFSFAVYPGHPSERDVQGLLERTRSETQRLWEQVSTYNEEHPPPQEARKVTFYCGQVTTGTDEEVEARNHE